ncbi:MAG: 30S ribosomal protein S18 [Parcubacteria group bacterium GW2011_GWC2_42_12]|uniref:Small ribosomal subunit protein bS18 n=1 Tax=Candidatus Falkowbacteria bacterium RIFCSPHIGHO2_02_FULL_42_9 TaxID=1797986 RepID=A0A1F5SAX6_9BACT|nr:MAG: 30S ribosomal protein S18 [Parcubacteria group bacterium GW2011_GWC2_42_12]OGF23603.1 MAG: 30S ribosomal protein S18 [Candidatus Falkowbacteria bacterium RIFCSPHIGHO2_02_FULL_42_9]
MEETIKKEKKCYFCVNNLKEVDYKDANFLRSFINSYGKILPKKRTGSCSKHQRKLAVAIKRARVMAIIPFVNK